MYQRCIVVIFSVHQEGHLIQLLFLGVAQSNWERRQCRACRLEVLLHDQVLVSIAADHVHMYIIPIASMYSI